jgi:serine/threonine protein kinase
MAPEVIFEKEYSHTVDYYAMGVVLYEMMMGERPYISSRKDELRVLMAKYPATIKKDCIPDGWSIEAADFANRLLHRNPQNRLGSNGMGEIKTHPWLKGFPWDKLERRQLISPYC